MDLSRALQKIDAMVDGFIAAIPNAALALVVFALIALGAKYMGRLFRRTLTRRWPHATLGVVFERLLRSVIILLGLLIALSITFPSFSARDLIQFLGIGTVAVGFAFRDVLQNFLAGIILLLTHPFRIGDEVGLDSIEGIVQEIETRATLIKTFDGTLAVIPNANILTRNVTVYSAFELRRSSLDFEVAQNHDVELARDSITEALSGLAGAEREPSPTVLAVGFSTSGGALFRATWWTKSSRREAAATKNEAVLAITRRIAIAEIDLALQRPDSPQAKESQIGDSRAFM